MSDQRVERYERALIYIAAAKPEGVPLTEADHERAAQVAAMVERYEAHLRASVKAARAEPDAPAPRVTRAPVRKRRRRARRAPAAGAAQPRKRGRPRKVAPPAEARPAG